MSEFTKNELKEMLGALHDRRMDIEEMLPENPLLEKLESMIDSYCDPKQIDGFVRHPSDYTGCNHDWQELEMHPTATATVICTKCRALHFIRETK